MICAFRSAAFSDSPVSVAASNSFVAFLIRARASNSSFCPFLIALSTDLRFLASVSSSDSSERRSSAKPADATSGADSPAATAAKTARREIPDICTALRCCCRADIMAGAAISALDAAPMRRTNTIDRTIAAVVCRSDGLPICAVISICTVTALNM